jgi:hypothetical protein
MESKLAEDMTPPSLAEILDDFRWMLTLPPEKCSWEQVINYFGHIELYRRELIKVANETIESGPASTRVVELLKKLADADLARRRRETYFSTLILLCRHHIKISTCGEQDYMVPSLLKKYFPPADAPPAWIPHVGLSVKEREIIAKERESMLQYLREVNEWEDDLEEEEDDRRRKQYFERFVEPFSRVSGRRSIGEVALVFAASIENNADALERLLAALG